MKRSFSVLASSRIVFLVTWASRDTIGSWGLIGVCKTKHAARELIQENRDLFEQLHGIASGRSYGITPTTMFVSVTPAKKGKNGAPASAIDRKRTK